MRIFMILFTVAFSSCQGVIKETSIMHNFILSAVDTKKETNLNCIPSCGAIVSNYVRGVWYNEKWIVAKQYLMIEDTTYQNPPTMQKYPSFYLVKADKPFSWETAYIVGPVPKDSLQIVLKQHQIHLGKMTWLD